MIDQDDVGLSGQRVLVLDPAWQARHGAGKALELIGGFVGISAEAIAPRHRPVRLGVVVHPEHVVALLDLDLLKDTARLDGDFAST